MSKLKQHCNKIKQKRTEKNRAPYLYQPPQTSMYIISIIGQKHAKTNIKKMMSKIHDLKLAYDV